MMASIWGTLGTIAGIAVAVALFMLAARFVARARKGNRRLRDARHDPHSETPRNHTMSPAPPAADGRDISQ
jgi:hypothetical protein